MKSYLYIIPILLITLSICSCNKKNKQLETNAKRYIQALADYDIDAATQYATPETQQKTLPFLKAIVGMVTDTNAFAMNKPAKIEITSVNLLSDTQAIVYYHKTTPINDFNDSISMRYHNGQWLAHQIIKIPKNMQNDNIPNTNRKSLAEMRKAITSGDSCIK